MKPLILFLCVLLNASLVSGENLMKRPRGEGFYKCESANTLGSTDLWTDLRIIGFIWDESPDKKQPKPFPFIEASLYGGLFNITEVFVESRIFSYLWNKKPQFGSINAGVKITTPNNRDIRLHGFGLELKYLHSFVKAFPSIAGYRYEGSGYSPEGFIAQGGSVQSMFLYDLDLIGRYSYLPFKLFCNCGFRIPLRKELTKFSQYLIGAGVGYCSSSFDIFLEYNMENLFNVSYKPKMFHSGTLELKRTWEVAFSENPWYLSLGGRIRYENGTVLLLCIPILVSSNQGSSITKADQEALLHQEKFNDEWARGISDPFDPWFAKWKIIMQVSFPLHFKQTSAELKRTFLLLKNRRSKSTIDIDEKLNGKKDELDENDRKKRLESIKKKREAIEQSE